MVSTNLLYLSPHQPLQRIENDVELLGEHLSLGAGLHYPPTTHPALTQHSTQLHFLSHDPLPQEFFGMVSSRKLIHYWQKQLIGVASFSCLLIPTLVLSKPFSSASPGTTVPRTAATASFALPPQPPALLPVSRSVHCTHGLYLSEYTSQTSAQVSSLSLSAGQCCQSSPPVLLSVWSWK